MWRGSISNGWWEDITLYEYVMLNRAYFCGDFQRCHLLSHIARWLPPLPPNFCQVKTDTNQIPPLNYMPKKWKTLSEWSCPCMHNFNLLRLKLTEKIRFSFWMFKCDCDHESTFMSMKLAWKHQVQWSLSSWKISKIDSKSKTSQCLIIIVIARYKPKTWLSIKLNQCQSY